MFTYVKCRCGRMLRARRSSEPATIRCWECHAEVRVPRHRLAEGPKAIDRFRVEMEADWGETFAAVVLLAACATGVVVIPRYGPWLALGVLAIGALLYLRRIEEIGELGHVIEPDRKRVGVVPRVAGWLGRLALALAVVVGLVGPLWLADGSAQRAYHAPPLPRPLPLVLILVAWLVVPLVAFILVARAEDHRLGTRRALAAAWRRRRSMLAALLLPIGALAGAEAATFGVLSRMDHLRPFVPDVFPMASNTEMLGGLVLVDGKIDYLTPAQTLQLYRLGLSRGATLVGSVPISFRRGHEARVALSGYGTIEHMAYLRMRLVITGVVLLIAIGALAVQAHCLGRIGASAPPPLGRRGGEAEAGDKPEAEGEAEDQGGRTPAPVALPGRAGGDRLAIPSPAQEAIAARPGPGPPS